VWLTLLAAIALPGLVLLSALGDSQQPSSEASQAADARSKTSEGSMDASSETRSAHAPPAASKTQDAAAVEAVPPTDQATALGTLNMGARPAGATLQVIDERSNMSVYDGDSPMTIRLPVGHYRVLTEKRGYLSNTTIVEVTATQAVDNQVVLTKSNASGHRSPKAKAGVLDNVDTLAPSF
jgi:hypothetical protein